MISSELEDDNEVDECQSSAQQLISLIRLRQDSNVVLKLN
jgi:hypothetical protein